ncbi:hypothetical protein [Amycolatopsis orientalis]|uniref:hypothetical protein n=1 Tax=Amycolatopsis orientalis TaxID=31958 RepID=UPI00039D4859|nr:hypothetical protein [Amycolatopsis orientalis]
MTADDPRIAQYERERAEAIEIAHKAMTTSYIGAPPPGLRGDADRMVAALIKAGWTPPQADEVPRVADALHARDCEHSGHEEPRDYYEDMAAVAVRVIRQY